MSLAPLPLTVKRSIELLGLSFVLLALNYASGIFAPLLMAFFLSILVLPIFRFLFRHRWPEMLAIFISLMVILLFMAAIVWFFSAQLSALLSDFPAIKKNVIAHLNTLSAWINKKAHFSTEAQTSLINEQSEKLLNFAGGLLGSTASSLTSLLAFFGLIPIYIFLILFYRKLLVQFIFSWFNPSDHERVRDTLVETQTILKSYLVGLFIQIGYITILLGGTLMLLGIKNALLIGVIFALLNLIPYVGALIGNIIGVLLTLTSGQELLPILQVLITIAVVQFLDNNILMPRIVGSKVRINALASIVGVIVGGSIAGISGMFLSLPMVAILKVIFDHSNHFKQWGLLFGDKRPGINFLSSPVVPAAAVEEKKD